MTKLSLATIIATVCPKYGLEPIDITIPTRYRPVVRAKMEISYRARQHGHSNPFIGERINADPSTVQNHIRRFPVVKDDPIHRNDCTAKQSACKFKKLKGKILTERFEAKKAQNKKDRDLLAARRPQRGPLTARQRVRLIANERKMRMAVKYGKKTEFIKKHRELILAGVV